MILGLSILIKIALLVAAGIAGYGAQFVFKKADTPVEQIAEAVIRKQTGWEVDFSKEETPSVTEDKKEG